MRTAFAIALAFALTADAGAADVRLSDERTLTRLVRPVIPADVRARPAPSAPAVGRLRFHTEDGPLEIYLALERRVVHGRAWLRLRIPGRPNGATGWVPRETVGPFIVRRTQLTVDRTRLRATLRDDGRIVWRSPIGVGAPATPTPAGRYWIRERLRGDDDVYGPWAFGTAAYSSLSDWPGGGVIGIHGTNAPALIPGRPSHGCIRVPNAAVRRLARLLPVGTPVRIR